MQAVRRTELMLGSEALIPAGAEETSRLEFRLSCVAAVDLAPGMLISPATLMFQRPGHGLPPRDAEQLYGRRLLRSVRRGEVILQEHLA